MSACANGWWQLTQGDRLHARLGDFAAGTTRHAHSWDEVRDAFADCTRRNFGVQVSTIDTLFRGGIWIVGEQYSRYQYWNAPDSLTLKPRLEMGHWSYRDGDVLEHEIGHAAIHDNPALRNPADTTGAQGEFDHSSPLFRACVHYCPISESGCRA